MRDIKVELLKKKKTQHIPGIYLFGIEGVAYISKHWDSFSMM
jgi:hypothetical protein